MNIDTPEGWRKGQTIFNFLHWLKEKHSFSSKGGSMMADPFYISDKILAAYFDVFLAEIKEGL